MASHLKLKARSHACCASAPCKFRGSNNPHLRAGNLLATASGNTVPTVDLNSWLQQNGAPEQALEIRSIDLPGAGRPLDLAVAKRDLQPGDIALSIPENLVVTLDRIFEDEGVAELLTTGKLSELACLALYLMYEKKIGKESFWYAYIKELDKQRARGYQAVQSALLWHMDELEDLLKGSPVVEAVKLRLAGIRKEYDELDTVWFMAGSLFNRYPFDIPTEAFSFELFLQAFAAVQASIVHLQGVGNARRFALVPLGPPLLSYSSTCKAMLAYNVSRRAVELVVDRPYSAGQPVYAWCGPQPNSRLLINYGIVDEHNPFDKLSLTVTLANTDPLFLAKRAAVQSHGLATQQAFALSRGAALPEQLLPYLRVAFAATLQQVRQVKFGSSGEERVDVVVETQVRCALVAYLNSLLASYKRSLSHDEAVIADPEASPKERIAARLTRIEKTILRDALTAVEHATDCVPCGGMGPAPFSNLHVKISPAPPSGMR